MNAFTLLSFCTFTIMIQHEIEASPMYAILRNLGFQRQYRICDSRTFHFFFKLACKYHNPIAAQKEEKILSTTSTTTQGKYKPVLLDQEIMLTSLTWRYKGSKMHLIKTF